MTSRQTTRARDREVFVALADRRDAHHIACRDWPAGRDEPLIVPPTVLAEVCYMIDKYLGAESEAKFLDSVGIGPSYRFQPVFAALYGQIQAI
jgi:uncharacterized protein